MEQKWYRKNNFWDYLENNNFQVTDMNTFYKNYPINSSDLIDISSRNFDLMLIISYNPTENIELKKYYSSKDQEWPILMLYFPWVKNVQIDWNLKEEISFEEIYVEIKNIKEELLETILESVFIHKIKILHKKEIYVTLFDQNENIIKLEKI